MTHVAVQAAVAADAVTVKVVAVQAAVAQAVVVETTVALARVVGQTSLQAKSAHALVSSKAKASTRKELLN